MEDSTNLTPADLGNIKEIVIDRPPAAENRPVWQRHWLPIGALITILGLGVQVSVWGGHIDARLEAFERAEAKRDKRALQHEERLSKLERQHATQAQKSIAQERNSRLFWEKDWPELKETLKEINQRLMALERRGRRRRQGE